jgi:hypothetical protein
MDEKERMSGCTVAKCRTSCRILRCAWNRACRHCVHAQTSHHSSRRCLARRAPWRRSVLRLAGDGLRVRTLERASRSDLECAAADPCARADRPAEVLWQPPDRVGAYAGGAGLGSLSLSGLASWLRQPAPKRKRVPVDERSSLWPRQKGRSRHSLRLGSSTTPLGEKTLPTADLLGPLWHARQRRRGFLGVGRVPIAMPLRRRRSAEQQHRRQVTAYRDRRDGVHGCCFDGLLLRPRRDPQRCALSRERPISDVFMPFVQMQCDVRAHNPAVVCVCPSQELLMPGDLSLARRRPAGRLEDAEQRRLSWANDGCAYASADSVVHRRWTAHQTAQLHRRKPP